MPDSPTDRRTTISRYGQHGTWTEATSLILRGFRWRRAIKKSLRCSRPRIVSPNKRLILWLHQPRQKRLLCALCVFWCLYCLMFWCRFWYGNGNIQSNNDVMIRLIKWLIKWLIKSLIKSFINAIIKSLIKWIIKSLIKNIIKSLFNSLIKAVINSLTNQ